MEHGTCSMSLISLDDLITKWFNMISNDVTNLFIHIARLAVIDSLHEAVVSGFDECSATLTYLSDAIGLVHVCMEAVDVAADVDVDDVTFLEWSGVWDSMTDDLIDRSATTSWELVIIQR